MRATRRSLMLAGAGLATIIGIPAIQHVAWNRRSFVRDGYDPDWSADLPADVTGWENWAGIERATPSNISAPDSVEALVDTILNANGRIRPVGSGHSFTGLAPTDGVMIDVSRISGLKAFDPSTGLATFGAGTRLFHMAETLADHGRALPNLPDIDVQTLAGSFSTATHGTGLHLTALHAAIRRFTLVTASGTLLDVSPESNPDLFSAGKVSLGALGVIADYTLATVPAFNLRRVVTVTTIEDAIDNAEANAAEARNFEFYYFPNTGLAATIRHDTHEGPLNPPPTEDGEDVLASLKDLRDLLGWQPWIRRKVIAGALPLGLIEDVSDASHKLLSTERLTKFIEMEYHLPLENGMTPFRQVQRWLDSRKDIFFPVEVRFTGADDAMLSPFNDGPRLSIAVHAAVDERYDYLFSELEHIHRANGGRPHWGKLHSLTYDDLISLYPRFQDFINIRRTLDPNLRLMIPHLARLFGEGLD